MHALSCGLMLRECIKKDQLARLVTEDEVRDAMRYAFRVLKLVVEPGGAVAVLAAMAAAVTITIAERLWRARVVLA